VTARHLVLRYALFALLATGGMREDSVVFAATDRVSMLAGVGGSGEFFVRDLGVLFFAKSKANR